MKLASSSTEQPWPGPEDEPCDLIDEVQPYPHDPPPFSLANLDSIIYDTFYKFVGVVAAKQAGKSYHMAVFDEMCETVWHCDLASFSEEKEDEAPTRKHKWVPITEPLRPDYRLPARIVRSSRTPWKEGYRRIR